MISAQKSTPQPSIPKEKSCRDNHRLPHRMSKNVCGLSLLTALSIAASVAIATLTPQQLYSPITLQPQPGTDENVLLCRVWVGSDLFMASYNEQTEWQEVSKQALAVTKAANEMVF